ncbi:uncharacterized protein LOC141686169 [Apium graveolens]|uniref:uncharacterized protein LOC141686169 n=1 Tax=Apium graveolens TaxID=4045 RepID=UPI003D7929B8
MDYIKNSVDAAILTEFNASGMGLVMRNDKGELIIARTKCNMGMVSVNMTEALAIKEVLSWIKSEDRNNVVVESDCLTAIQAIRSKATLTSPFGQVIQSCRDILLGLNTVCLFFVKRSANKVAHELARLSYSFPDRVFDKIRLGLMIY